MFLYISREKLKLLFRKSNVLIHHILHKLEEMAAAFKNNSDFSSKHYVILLLTFLITYSGQGAGELTFSVTYYGVNVQREI